MHSSNKAYDSTYDQWSALHTGIERKILIFIILRYCQMMRKKTVRPLNQLALLSKEELEKICRDLEKETIGKED